MAQKKTSPAMEFVLAQLKKNPAVEYRTVKDASVKKGLPVYPIMYGRAKALLGLVPVAPRGSKKKKKAKARVSAPTTVSGAGRSRGTSRATNPLQSLEAMLDDMKQVAVERDRFKKALEQISQVLKSVL